MKSSHFFLRGAAAAAMLTLASVAQAGLVFSDYFGTDDANGNPALGVNSVAGRAAFSAMLTDQKPTQGFEDFANGTTAAGGLSLFGDATKTLTSATGKVTNVNNDGSGFTGRFNTGACDPDARCNWWETAYTFTLDFGTSDFSAFAFYGTDFSDFGGTVYLELLSSDLSAVKASILVSGPTAAALLDTSATAPGAGNGSMLHFGFTDDTQSYGGVRFVVMQLDGTPPASYDFLGFDDLILGNVAAAPPGGVPEPATLALVALSLAGLAASRRKAQPKR